MSLALLEPLSLATWPSHAVLLILGAVLVLAGRRVWVLAIAFGGYALGWLLAAELGLARTFSGGDLVLSSGGPAMWFGIFAGVGCAILCFALQRLVVSVAGFLAGALVALFLLRTLTETSFAVPGLGGGAPLAGWIPLALIAVGGMVGAFASGLLFRFALAVATSAMGAVFIAAGLHLEGEVAMMVALVLTLVGVVAQGRGKKSTRRERRRALRRSARAG